jgi:hypothetical protein
MRADVIDDGAWLNLWYWLKLVVVVDDAKHIV